MAASSPGLDLTGAFRTFYAEAARLRRWIAAHGGALPTPESANTATPPELEAVRDPIVKAIRSSVGAVSEPTPLEKQLEDETRFLMAVFADDLFTRMTWPFQEAWSCDPLELKFFGTKNGATLVFQRIDALLKTKDADRRPLAQLYLMALLLGFEGSADASDRARERSRLESFLSGAASFDLGKDPLFAQAYDHTVSPPNPTLLPNLRRWLLIAFLVLVLLTVASYPLWNRATDPLKKQVDQILERDK